MRSGGFAYLRINLEPVFTAGGCRVGEDVSCRTGRALAARGNPDRLQGKPARYGGKKTAQTASRVVNTGSETAMQRTGQEQARHKPEKQEQRINELDMSIQRLVPTFCLGWAALPGPCAAAAPG